MTTLSIESNTYGSGVDVLLYGHLYHVVLWAATCIFVWITRPLVWHASAAWLQGRSGRLAERS